MSAPTPTAGLDRSAVPGRGPLRPFHFPRVHRRALANGLTVLVAEVRNFPIVTVDVTLDAGGLAEPAEMERAITGLEARHLFDLQKVNERADQISMLTTYFDAPELISTELDRYRAVTAEDVRRVAAGFLTADNRVVLTYLPDAEAPAEAS